MKAARFRREIPLHLMLIPGVLVTIIFSYVPMFGIVMAFQKFSPIQGFLGSPWIGFDNFTFILNLPNMSRIFFNTVYMALFKIIGGLVVPIIFALLLNEVSNSFIKRTAQTIIYLPHFISWIILSGIFIDLLSPSTGIVNSLITALGFEPIFFLGDKFWFPITMIVTEIWKSFGYGTIIYMAALTNIDPSLYESAAMDGANKWSQTIHITLPGMAPIIVLMTVLNMGNVLNAGFDQIFNMYNPVVYESGDIIDTFVYRMGMEQFQYAPAAAIGLLKSVISLIFISLSYFLADKLANYRVI